MPMNSTPSHSAVLDQSRSLGPVGHVHSANRLDDLFELPQSSSVQLVLVPRNERSHLPPVELSRGRHMLGSGPQCDVVIQGEGVADRHCSIIVGERRTIVKAWSPLTWINDDPVREGTLKAGDRLIIGPVEFHVRPQSAAPPSLPHISGLPSDRAPRAVEASDKRPIPAAPSRQRLDSPKSSGSLPSPEARRHLERQDRLHRELLDDVQGLLEEILRRERAWDETVARERSALDQILRDLELRDRETDAERERILSESQALEQRRQALLLREHRLAGLEPRWDEMLSREAELDARHSELAERAMWLGRTNRHLRQRMTILERLEREQQQRDEALDLRAAELHRLEERSREVDLLHQQLDRDIQALHLEEGALRVRGAELDAERERLANAGRELDEREQALEARTIDLEQIRTRFFAERQQLEQERENWLNQRSDQEHHLFQRQAELETRVHMLDESERQLADRQSELQSRNEDVICQQRALDERLAELDEEFERLDRQRREFEVERAATVEERVELDRRLATFESERAEIMERQQSLESRHAKLHQLEQALIRREADAESHAAELSEAQRQIDESRSQLDVREAELSAEETRLEGWRDELEGRSSELADRARRLSGWNRDLRRKEEQLDLRQATVVESEGSQAQRAEELLQQQTSLEQLTAQLEELERCVHEDRARNDAEQVSWLEAQASLQQEREELERLRLEIDSTRQELEERVRETAESSPREESDDSARADDSAGQLEALRMERDQLTRQVEELDTERQRLNQWQESLNEQERSLAERRAEIENQFQDIDSERSAFNTKWLAFEQRVQDQALQQASTDDELRNLKQESDRLTQLREELIHAEEELTRLREELALERQELAQERASLSQEQAEFLNEREQLSQERQVLSMELEKVSQEQDTLSQEREQLDQERDELDRVRNRLDTEREELSREREHVPVASVATTNDPDGVAPLTDMTADQEIAHDAASEHAGDESPSLHHPTASESVSEAGLDARQFLGDWALDEAPSSGCPTPSLLDLFQVPVSNNASSAESETVSDLLASFGRGRVEEMDIDHGVEVSKTDSDIPPFGNDEEREADLIRDVDPAASFADAADDHREESSERSLQLRSELAEMFGLPGDLHQRSGHRDDAPGELDEESISDGHLESPPEPEPMDWRSAAIASCSGESKPAVSDPPSPSPLADDTAATDDEDPIASYMERLLARTRRHGHDDTPPSPVVRPTPPPQPIRGEHPQPQTQVYQTDGSERMSEMDSFRQRPRKLNAQEKEALRENLNSFRSLANFSARTAVAKSHVNRRQSSLRALSLATGLGWVATGLLATADHWLGMSHPILTASIAVASATLTAFAARQLWAMRSFSNHAEARFGSHSRSEKDE